MVYENKDNGQGKCRTCQSNSKPTEALSETNMRSSQTDVSFIGAALDSVCVSVFKQFQEPVPQSCEHRQYQGVWTKIAQSIIQPLRKLTSLT